MRKYVRLLITLFVILNVTSCSYFTKSSTQSQDNDYLTARSVPPLRIPPGVSSRAFETYYPVSDRQYPASSKTISLIPPGLTKS